MALHRVVQSELLLLEDSLLGAQALTVRTYSGKGVLLLDELGLVGNPFLMDLGDLILHLVDLLLDVILLCLEWSGIFVLAVLLLKFVQLAVKSVNSVLLFGNGNVTLLDITLELLNFALLVLKLINQVVKLLLQKFILRLSVQVVDAHTRDLISNIFYLNFLLGDLLIGNLSLLD